MKKISLTVVLIVIFISATAHAGEWYEGGTLHDGTVNDWSRATTENKVATSADWSMAVESVKQAVWGSLDIETVKPYAAALAVCVEMVSRELPGSTPLPNIAAYCATSMEW